MTNTNTALAADTLDVATPARQIADRAIPISLLAEAVSVPHRYHMVELTQRCLHCNSEHKYSQVFAYNTLRTRTGAGKWIEHFTTLLGFSHNLPKTRALRHVEILPACFECWDALSLDGLPIPPPRTPELVGGHRGTLDNIDAAPKTATKKLKSADELLEGF